MDSDVMVIYTLITYMNSGYALQTTSWLGSSRKRLYRRFLCAPTIPGIF